MFSTLPPPRPDLPFELEREIFELAANACPRDGVRLCLVAQRVKIWIERLLYHSLVFNFPLSRAPSFLESSKSRSEEFFVSHVKKLYMTSMVSPNHAEQILQSCTGITELTCWTQLPRTESLARVLPSLSRLSINATTFARTMMETDFDFAALSGLTHLDIVTPSCRSDEPVWSWILKFPGLTDLSVGNLYSSMEHKALIPAFQYLLDACPKLQTMILITSDDDVDQSIQSQLQDDRVVIVPNFHHPKDLRTYWEDVSASRGEMDFWHLARK